MLFLFLFLILVFRLLWIQTSSSWKIIKPSTSTINELAVRQRQEGIELDSGRGHIVDRNGVAMTGEVVWTPVLFPLKQLPSTGEMNRIASLLHTTTAKLHETWRNLKIPQAWEEQQSGGFFQVKQDELQQWRNLKGIMVLPYMNRYAEGIRGNQWLGYLAEQPELIKSLGIKSRGKRDLNVSLGAAGLERSFDFYLRAAEKTAAYYAIDGKGRALKGVGATIKGQPSNYLPLVVHSTIDHTLQRKIEQLTEDQHIEQGAIVVLDATNGDVISMVSRPFYDPKRINLEQGEWSNSAVKAAVPGSIFKTVIAAAALEKGVTQPNEVFRCNRQYGKYGLSCWLKEGHGDITLEDGYAHSCNIVFATLGERLSEAEIMNTAYGLGLGRKIGWQENNLQQIDQEEAGIIFKAKQADGGVRAQTAIGQRDVQITPLQAANLVVTLLNDGKVAAPRLVSAITYKDGSHFIDFERKVRKNEHQISPRTSRTITSWMRKVVVEGTGQSLQSAKWTLAGKSGTAQVTYGSKPRNHHWFIGYGPTEKPQYAVAVLIKNQPISAKNKATLLFKETMNILADHSKLVR